MRSSFIITAFILAALLTSGVLLNCSATNYVANQTAEAAPTPAAREIALTDGEFDGKEIVKSNDEWKKELTADEYYVMREEGTERAYTGALTDNKKRGTYHCAACGLALFKSEAKFDSGTGWPSFFQPIFKKNVVENEDRSIPTEVRTEVECARCHAHLGHVFDDGPRPTGLRYCMNSVSLRFKETK